ncbi:hypothetical protein TrLO_g3346 [Triparma laevis f. longispina]|uniref:Uncharacterized protein n=1 Tax=Triparma laevis f. longispina TaxID=1714387 RepID=A0A9W7FPN0_9STRA|nr:hypothetical protein TrLO_g3346 [Triparma laevis f. longispina]
MGVCSSTPVSAEEAAKIDLKKIEKMTAERERIEACQAEKRRKSRSRSSGRESESDHDDEEPNDDEMEAMGLA